MNVSKTGHKVTLKQKIRRQMTGDLIVSVIYAALTIASIWWALASRTAGGEIAQGLIAAVFAWCSAADARQFLRARKILRDPLFYLMAVRHDLMGE